MLRFTEKNKTLVASGCSFTDQNFYSPEYPEIDCTFPKWPEIVGKKLDLNVVNLAKSGECNDTILDDTIRYINKHSKDVHTVMIGWTEWDRINFFGHMYKPTHLAYYAWNEKQSTQDPDYVQKVEDNWNPLGSFLDRYKEQGIDLLKESLTRNQYREDVVQAQYDRIVQLSLVCKGLGIKLITYQLLCPVDIARYLKFLDLDRSEFSHQLNLYAKEMMKAYQESPIKDKNHIGFPYLQSIGGSFYVGTPSNQMGPNDGHPNAQGHEKIAQAFLRRYKQLYG
jgi:hypothetical protein